MTDIEYMRQALELALKGTGWVNPNPLVGAVIVKEGRVIGSGYHKGYGELHAERDALRNCTESPEGADIYVTLEPCCHYGKTPPCTDAIIESGIRKVFIGSDDPNPKVAGKGIGILRNHGIEVQTGVLQTECYEINQVFFHYIKNCRPYVIMKYAMTMDGKIATCSGKSKWITGEAARHRVHQDRHRYMGIMVGVGTVLADDPSLDCRLPQSKNPVRIICDTHLRTPLTAKVVQTSKQQQTILATCCCDLQKQQPYLDAGCEVVVLPQKEEHIDLPELMNRLGQKGLDSILLEGGSTLNWAAMQSGIVNQVQTYLAPKLFGGADAKSPVGGMGVAAPDEAFCLSPPQITVLGPDILLESRVIEREVSTCLPELSKK